MTSCVIRSWWESYSCRLRSVWPLSAHPSRIRCERRGTLEQRLHTRYDRLTVCIAVVACVALHHHRLPRQSEHNPLDALSATCTTCCDPYTTVLVQLCHATHTWYVLGEGPTLAKEGSRWIVGRSVGVAHSPTDARDAWGLMGSRTLPDNAARGPPAGARVGETRSKPYRVARGCRRGSEAGGGGVLSLHIIRPCERPPRVRRWRDRTCNLDCHRGRL